MLSIFHWNLKSPILVSYPLKWTDEETCQTILVNMRENKIYVGLLENTGFFIWEMQHQ
jgi:hypothetical protein